MVAGERVTEPVRTTLPSPEEDLRDLFVAVGRVDERITALRDHVDTLEKAGLREDNVFNTTLNEWKASANEWRSSLNDLSARMITRSETEAMVKNLAEKVDTDKLLINDLQQRVGVGGGEKIGADKRTQNIYAGIAAFGSVLGIIGFIVGIIGFTRPG